MQDFTFAHAFTSKWEGGLVDHAADPGGITNYGISFRFLKDWAIENEAFLHNIGVQMPISSVSIRNLLKAQAEAIYKRAFWAPLKPETFPSLTVVAIYDASVNTGQRRSIKLLQQACNSLEGTKIEEDGIIGPVTRNRANIIGRTESDDLELAFACLEARRAFYKSLSTFPVFGKGWIARTEALGKYLANEVRCEEEVPDDV